MTGYRFAQWGCALNASWPRDLLQPPSDWTLRVEEDGEKKGEAAAKGDGRELGWQRTHEGKQILAPLPWR